MCTSCAHTGKTHHKRFLSGACQKGAVVYTDESGLYKHIHKEYQHNTVQHHKGEYVRDDVHTQSIDSFWALLRRGYYGTYHYMSPKHLHRYVNEFAGRLNAINQSDLVKMALLVKGMEGRILPYNKLTETQTK